MIKAMKPRIDKLNLEKYFKKVAKFMGFGLTYNKQTPTNKNLEAKPFPPGYPFCNYEYFGIDSNTGKPIPKQEFEYKTMASRPICKHMVEKPLSKQELKKRFKEDII